MFRSFFIGRYGPDKLFYFLFIIGIILNLFHVTWLLGMLCFAFAIYRVFSRNFERRRYEARIFEENWSKFVSVITPILDKVNNFFNAVANKIKFNRNKFSQRKVYTFVKCSICKNTLRLPKGKGKLQVTCPVCKNQFFKKT